MFRDESVMAPRFSSSCTKKTHHQSRASVLSVQHLPRRRLGKRPPPNMELTQQRKHQRIGRLLSLVYLYDTCTRLPPHPTPYCCSPSKKGQAFKTLQQWATKAAVQQLPNVMHFLTKVQCQMTAHCYPRKLPVFEKKIDQPA